MIKSIYHPYYLDSFGLLEIVEMYTNDILILANNIISKKEKEVLKNVKIIRKNLK